MKNETEGTPGIVVAYRFRAFIRAAVLRDLSSGRVDPAARPELECFAARLAGTGRLPLPDSCEARQAVAQALAGAVSDAGRRGDWRAVVALAPLVEAVVHRHGLTAPSVDVHERRRDPTH